jgi:hypothetical protein
MQPEEGRRLQVETTADQECCARAEGHTQQVGLEAVDIATG